MESGHRLPSINVLYILVKELDISLDNLFFKGTENEYIRKIKILLSDCSEQQLKLIEEIILAIKKNI